MLVEGYSIPCTRDSQEIPKMEGYHESSKARKDALNSVRKGTDKHGPGSRAHLNSEIIMPFSR